ncbi:MAG: hypothetical protein V1743_01160 [Nanoarchaeota archaeon]
MNKTESKLGRVYKDLCDRIDDGIEKVEDRTFETLFGHSLPLYGEEFCTCVIVPAVLANLALSGVGAYYIISRLW